MKNGVLLFLSEVHLTNTGHLVETIYKTPEREAVSCHQTNGATVKYLSKILASQGESIDRIFAFSTRRTQENIEYLAGPDNRSQQAPQRDIFLQDVAEILPDAREHIVYIDFDENCPAESTMDYVMLMVDTIRDSIGADGREWSKTINGVKLTFATTKQYIVKYNGDDKYISMVKKNGGVDKATDTFNVTGQDLNGTDIFDVDSYPATGTAMLNQLMYAVAKIEDGDHIWAGEEGMTIADTVHSNVLGAETKMAARQQAYKAAAGMLTTQNESIVGDITDVSSTDVAYLATKLMEYQTIYSMSLSVGSKILPGSLADYLN